MDDNGWEYGEDEEELFELAMHDRQYRDYKSGVAKKRFMDDLQRAQDAAMVKLAKIFSYSPHGVEI